MNKITFNSLYVLICVKNHLREFSKLNLQAKRSELHSIVSTFGLNSQQAIHCSQELDKLILEIMKEQYAAQSNIKGMNPSYKGNHVVPVCS